MSKKRYQQIPVQSTPPVINVQPSQLNVIWVLTRREQIALGCLVAYISTVNDHDARPIAQRVTRAFNYADEFIRQS